MPDDVRRRRRSRTEEGRSNARRREYRARRAPCRPSRAEHIRAVATCQLQTADAPRSCGHADAVPSTEPVWLLVPPPTRRLATLGARIASGIVIAVGGLMVFMGGAPSDPCRAGEPCGPDPMPLFLLGSVLVTLGIAGVALTRSIDRRWRRSFTFHTPPGWPSTPPGWQPTQGWRPDPSWLAPPDDWEWWLPADVPVNGHQR